MTRSRFCFRRTFLYGSFLLGVLWGVRIGNGFLREQGVGLSIAAGTVSFPRAFFLAAAPLLPVLFLGTSSLGYLLIPSVSMLRGLSFSMAVTAAAAQYPPEVILSSVGIPGFFGLTAFFLGCESASEDSLKIGEYVLTENSDSRTFRLILIFLLLGAAARVYYSTLF